MPLHIPTPLIESAPLSRAAVCRIWLKLEELEVVASIATSLGARQVCTRAFELSQSGLVHSVRVSKAPA